jgi:hypothetical protein
LSPLIRTFCAACEFLAHALLLVILETVMIGIEKWVNFIGVADRVFHFHKISIPQKELFDGADLGLLLCILTIGIVATIKKYRETQSPVTVRVTAKVTARSGGEK